MPTSPYLVREAKKLSIGAKADHRPGDYRYPRNQREAGIEYMEWENRLKPPCRSHWLHTAMFWLAVTFCWAVFAGAVWWGVGS
jgi:hypothetical protein